MKLGYLSILSNDRMNNKKETIANLELGEYDL